MMKDERKLVLNPCECGKGKTVFSYSREGWAKVACLECDAHGQFYKTEIEAADAWNIYNPPAQPALKEADAKAKPPAAMSHEEMRVAIAEVLGWKLSNESCGIKWVPPSGSYLYPWHQTKEQAWKYATERMSPKLPNYPEDLNACHHDFIPYLNSKSRGGSSIRQLDICFRIHLADIVNGRSLWENGRYLGNHFDTLKTCLASADQWCIAFLKTVGKWR